MIRVIQLSKSFKKKQVLNQIDYHFAEGKIYGIRGENGSGKSVFFKILSGLMLPSSGEVQILGKKIGERGQMAPCTGILIEKPGFLSYLSGIENLRLLASIKKIATETKLNKLLDLFGLLPDADTKVKNYSLGMKQKLGIIQALMEEPKIILLDEPFNGLDDESRRLTKQIIQEYRIAHNATFLITSHVETDFIKLCDHVLVLEEGQLFAQTLQGSN